MEKKKFWIKSDRLNHNNPNWPELIKFTVAVDFDVIIDNYVQQSVVLIGDRFDYPIAF